MRDALLEGPFLHIDETVVQVLKEAGKAPTSNSYMWVQTGGPPGRPVVLFDYDASRGGQVPVRLLHDYRGYVMTEGYSGYNELMRTDGIEQLICWAHVRRRFVEAVKVQPKGKRGLADEAVALIGKLYRIERDHKHADDAMRLLARQQQSLPVLATLRTWLDKALPGVTPKSALGTALSYLRDYWPRLTRYTERGDLPIDNNRAENAIRPFVIGRNYANGSFMQTRLRSRAIPPSVETPPDLSATSHDHSDCRNCINPLGGRYRVGVTSGGFSRASVRSFIARSASTYMWVVDGLSCPSHNAMSVALVPA